MNRTQDPKVVALQTVDVFAGLTRRDLREVSRLMTEVRIPAGQVLCEQGAHAQEVFVVLDGTVEVSRAERSVGVVGAGGIIGEMALVDGGPRTATTTARSEVTALALSRSEFRQLMTQFPAVATRFRAISAQRSAEIALLPAA